MLSGSSATNYSVAGWRARASGLGSYTRARAWSSIEPSSPLKALGTVFDHGLGRDVAESVDPEPVYLTVIDCVLAGALDAAERMRLPHACWCIPSTAASPRAGS
jgi:hypothetical protein